MERKELDFALTVQDAFVLGIKNAPAVAAAFILWLLTIWIPYINVGTTIAISLLPVEIAKGGVVNPLGIFDAHWRRYMGDYFLLVGLTLLPVLIATLFLVVPGIVLSLSWSLALYILFEKGKSPLEALYASNKATYGSKKWIFLASLLIGLLVSIVYGLVASISLLVKSPVIMSILLGVCMLLVQAISLATYASIWRQLKDNVA